MDICQVVSVCRIFARNFFSISTNVHHRLTNSRHYITKLQEFYPNMSCYKIMQRLLHFSKSLQHKLVLIQVQNSTNALEDVLAHQKRHIRVHHREANDQHLSSPYYYRQKSFLRPNPSTRSEPKGLFIVNEAEWPIPLLAVVQVLRQLWVSHYTLGACCVCVGNVRQLQTIQGHHPHRVTHHAGPLHERDTARLVLLCFKVPAA